jgi:hypothetical protein
MKSYLESPDLIVPKSFYVARGSLSAYSCSTVVLKTSFVVSRIVDASILVSWRRIIEGFAIFLISIRDLDLNLLPKPLQI